MINSVNQMSFVYQSPQKAQKTTPVGSKKVHVSTFDNVTISDEARQRAAEGGPLTHKEGIVLALENRRTQGIPIPEYIPLWEDSAIEGGATHTTSLHNLAGRFHLTVGPNNQAITAVLREDGIWLANGHNPKRSDFVLINPQQAVPGIPPATIRGLDFTLRIIQNITVPEGQQLIGKPGSFDMLDSLSRVIDGFIMLREQQGIFEGSTQHFEDPVFRDALVLVMRYFFEETVIMDNLYAYDDLEHSGAEFWEKVAHIEQLRSEARNQADVFTDVFFAHFLTQGAEAALNAAWAAVQPE